MIQILLTNDDGIQSPGLWAAAEVLSRLGFVHVAAPRDQFSAASRSMPSTSDGLILTQDRMVNHSMWKVHAVSGTPAQSVQHAILEILPEKPDLVVAGINYGENVGTHVTVSGTVGAAMEGAAFGIPALAVSLQVDKEHYYSLSEDVNFEVAAYFTGYFARLVLEKRFPADVDLLKIDIPEGATPETPWVVTRLTRRHYYEPLRPLRDNWDTPGKVRFTPTQGHESDFPDTDAYVLSVRRMVSVTPLSLDLTSRINLIEYEQELRRAQL